MQTKSISIPIEEMFEGKCISDSGCKILDEIIPKFEDRTILIEVFCNNRLNYDFPWEAANVYAYKISKCMLEKGVKTKKLRCIGYGNLDIENTENKNIIKITVLEPETLIRSN